MSRQSIERQLEQLLTTPATARVRIAFLTSLLESLPPTQESTALRNTRYATFAVHGCALLAIFASMSTGDSYGADALVVPAVLASMAATLTHHFVSRAELKRFADRMGEVLHPPSKLHAAQWTALVGKSHEIAEEVREHGLENAIRTAPRNAQEATLRRLGAGLLDVDVATPADAPASQEDWARLMEAIYRGRTDTVEVEQ